MEYIDGLPFSAAHEMTQADRDRIGEMIYRFAFGSIYRHGLFNGDPHPGNYRLLRDGRMAFLDYGQVSQFPPNIVERFANIIRALLDGDLERWRRACETLGILLPDSPYSTDVLYDHMRWFWAPILEDEVEMTPEIAGEMVRRNAQTTGHGGQINQWCAIPEGMVFLTRINFGLAGVLSALRATGPFRAIVEEYVCGAPPSTPLGEASWATSHGPGI
jgi:predicted unusual protein kinase regulating ubiquinone biosynthesis (AarF/ABC1/UbiB family)